MEVNVQNMKGNFNKKIETLRSNQREILEMD